MEIDLNEKLFVLIEKDNQLKQILYDIGFREIIKPGMLKTVGKIMTLKKGAKMRNIDIKQVADVLIEKGYKVVGYDE